MIQSFAVHARIGGWSFREIDGLLQVSHIHRPSDCRVLNWQCLMVFRL
jgi:hypothetical protein